MNDTHDTTADAIYVGAAGSRGPNASTLGMYLLCSILVGLTPHSAMAGLDWNSLSPGVEYYYGAQGKTNEEFNIGMGQQCAPGDIDAVSVLSTGPDSPEGLAVVSVPVDGGLYNGQRVSLYGGTFDTAIQNGGTRYPGWSVRVRIEPPSSIPGAGPVTWGATYVTVLQKGSPIPGGNTVFISGRLRVNYLWGRTHPQTCAVDERKENTLINPDVKQPASPAMSVVRFRGYTLGQSLLSEGTTVGDFQAGVPGSVSYGTASARWDPGSWSDTGAGDNVNRITSERGDHLDVVLACDTGGMSSDTSSSGKPAYWDSNSKMISCTLKKHGSDPVTAGEYPISIQASVRHP